MNKKDCEKIANILAQYDFVNPDLLDDLFELDSRIEENYIWDKNYYKAKQKTHKLYEQYMIEEYGPNWCILKNKPTKERSKELWEKAEHTAFAYLNEEEDEDE